MPFTFDAAKRKRILCERGLDFARAHELFSGPTLSFEDARRDYGETRMVTVGELDGRLTLVVWTERADERRIISMRHCNEREKARYEKTLARS